MSHLTTDKPPIGYGLIGAGGFGRFCVNQYRELEAVHPIAVADVNRDAAESAAEELGLEACDGIAELLARDDIQLVHIATPPTTHFELVTRALDAGKHVLCEKPLATNLDDAQTMARSAEEKGLILAADLIMRYNPLAEAVHEIIGQKLLGQPLHGFFENYAKDEPLPPGHWFWDKSKSGGIFIEHGVHFFELFEWWLGAGRVEAAQQVIRPGGDGLVEQVQATLRYNDPVDADTGGALVNFYHGFTQATRMDRQEMRLLFERGTVRLFEWVPTAIEIDALLTEDQLALLTRLLHEPKIQTLATYTDEERKITSRHKDYETDGRYRITADVGMDKQALYGHVLRHLLADQIAAIHTPGHHRRVSHVNGVNCLAVADEAEHLACSAPSH